MKIQLRIRTKDNKVLAGAKLVIVYKHPQKKTWRSEPLEADNSGRIWYEMDNKLFSQIHWKRVRFEILHNGQKVENTFSEPEEMNPGMHLIDIVATTEEGPIDRRSGINALVAFTIGEKRNPVVGADLIVGWKNLEGKKDFIYIKTTDQKGNALLSLTEKEFFSIPWPECEFRAEHPKITFSNIYLRSGKVEKVNKGEYSHFIDLVGVEKAPRPTDDIITINGTLRDAKNKPIPSARIQVYQKGIYNNSFNLESSGNFELKITKKDYQSIDWDSVTINVKQGEIWYEEVSREFPKPKESQTKTWGLVFKKKNDVVVPPEPNPEEKPSSKPINYNVSGRVLNEKKQPVPNIFIQVFHKGIGTEQKLGGKKLLKTDSKGFYHLAYSPEEIDFHQSKNINLIARAYSGAQAKKPLAASRFVSAAKQNQILDLEVPTEAYATPSLFIQIENKLKEIKLLGKIQEYGAEDAELIAKELGEDTQTILQFVQSFIMSAFSTKLMNALIPAEPFFGLVKGGMPPNPVAFAAMRDKELSNKLQKAINENWISKMDVSASVNAIRPLRVKLLLQESTPWMKILKKQGLSDSQIEQLAEEFLKTDLPIEVLIKNLLETGEINEEQKDTFLESTSLNDFVDGNETLLNGLVEDYNVSTPRDLLVFSDKDWRTISKIYFNPIPNWAKGKTEQEKRSNIVKVLKCRLEKILPTPVFAKGWFSDEKLKGEAVLNYFSKQPKLEFKKTNLENYWKNNSKPSNQKIHADSLRTERLFHLSPDCGRFSVFKALWNENIQSAEEILKHGRGVFLKRMEKAKLSKIEANAVFQKAQRLASKDLLVRDWVPVGNPDNTGSSKPSSPIAKATLATLFGETGGTVCDPCLSALSPSAYLIDLLRFLERATTGNSNKSGLDLLFERRPDIQNLVLDCENSHTVLPYIDLVNEILEHVVATSSVPFNVPQEWLVTDQLENQTQWTSEQLAAHPEHILPQAYNRLRTVFAPWGLPYNLWADEVRTYLSQLSIDRFDLMVALHPNEDPFKVAELALERLGLDPAESLTLSQPANNQAKRLLLWHTGNPATHLSQLQRFMQQTDLSFEVIVSYFDTRFINPDRREIIPANIVDPANTVLNFTQADNNELLDRFHRFARLHCKTGWSVNALDSALYTVANQGLNAESLLELGILAELQYRHNVPIEDVISWFGLIPCFGSGKKISLYHNTFLAFFVSPSSNARINLVDEVFSIKENSYPLELAVVSSSHDKWLAKLLDLGSEEAPELHPLYTPVVTAGCGISSQELALLLSSEHFEFTGTTFDLTLENLSLIYRYASTARALGISVSEYLLWVDLLGQPLGVIQTSQQVLPALSKTVLTFPILKEFIKKGLSADLLRATLQGKSAEAISPNDDDIVSTLENIQTELLKVQETSTEMISMEEAVALSIRIVSDLSEQDRSDLLRMILGEIEPNTPLTDRLNFLSADTASSLFDSATSIPQEERLLLVYSAIPFDIQKIDALTKLIIENTEETEETVIEVVSSLLEYTSAPSLSPEYLPSTSELDLLNAPLEERISSLYVNLFRKWVLLPSIIQRISTTESTEESLIEHFVLLTNSDGSKKLSDHLLSEDFLESDIESDADVIDAYTKLVLQTTLAKEASISLETLKFSTLYGNEYKLLDWSRIGQNTLIPWNTTWKLNKLLELGTSSITAAELLESAYLGTENEGVLLSQLADLLNISEGDLSTLLSSKALNFETATKALSSVQFFQRVVDGAAYIQKLKVDASQAISMASPILNEPHAHYAKAAVRANYGEKQWLEVSEKLREGLRERQRDALLAFLRTRGGFNLTHEQAYAFYLIDVDMGACYQTSRTKQAIASVQQFIQRILLGLEFDGLPNQGKALQFYKEDAIEWKWRKNYRVWEANVKVFLYPENWLEPELRDNKTPLFLSFEQELSQGELTHDFAVSTVTTYLEKLHEISQLDIVNLCVDTNTNTYHAVGRTKDLPHQYFVRNWNGELWSPWKPIETEIESDQVIPIVHNNQLYIFWALFEGIVDEQAVENTGLQDQIDSIADEIMDIGGADGEGGKVEETREKKETAEANLAEFVDDFGNSDSWSKNIVKTYEDAIESYQNTIDSYKAQLSTLHAEKIQLERQLELEIAANTFEEVQMSWITEHPKGWSAKKQSKQKLKGSKGTLAVNYHFMADTNSKGELEIWALTGDLDFSDNSQQPYLEGLFVLSSCTSEMTIIYESNPSIPFLMAYQDSKIEQTHHIIQMIAEGGRNAGDFSPLGIGTVFRDSPESSLKVTRVLNRIDQPFPCFVDSGPHLFFAQKSTLSEGEGTSYEFHTHYHPYTCAMIRQIRRYGIKGLYTPEEIDLLQSEDSLALFRQLTPNNDFNFVAEYDPVPSIVNGGVTQEKIDFSYQTGYGQYNWEVFFHIPITVATRLMQNRKFEEAQQWFHYIFDPTETEGNGLQKYWKIKPFYWAQVWGLSDDSISEQLDELDTQHLESMIEHWEDNPFQPHAIARFRIVSYMRMTVMKYLDNLIEWGDSLFRQDSMESINEATQLYVIAANILGERPLLIHPDSNNTSHFTVKETLDQWALRPVSSGSTTPGNMPVTEAATSILGVLDQFCLPFNDRLLDYWDTVEDRLFKIRNCLNINGVFRKLPLFQPPIDPALLVKAAASGLDFSSALADLSAPRPHYRFGYMLQRAKELSSITQSFGAQLLSALEKKDAEHLAQLRADHEVEITKLGLDNRKDAIREAKLQLEIIEKGKETIELRRDFYAGRDYMNVGETLDLTLRFYSWYLRTLSQVAQAAVTPMKAIPEMTLGAAGVWGSPVSLTTIPKPAEIAKSGVNVLGIFADLTQTGAGMAQTIGGFDRRKEEWDHQVELAENEIAQFEKQIEAAKIRINMAEKELQNLERQVELSEESRAFVKDKFTNKELYNWIVTQTSSLYFQSYQLAYETAKKAEKCYQYELGNTDTQFIQFGYWDSLKKGLLAGERIQLDLQRMESAYEGENSREYELSKTISLFQIDPLSLMRLQQTGECYIQVPEKLFDLDYPGHYFRRIKSISLTIPAIVGPYTNLCATLTLLTNRYRNAAKSGEDDNLFAWEVGSIESVATSRGNQDTGLFQLDFNDPRYLPFERAGAQSSWRLCLNDPDLAQFDYSTISDVLLTINYTARDGGEAYKKEVKDNLKGELTSLLNGKDSLLQSISIKQEFGETWSRFKNLDSEAENSQLSLQLTESRFPYFVRERGIAITGFSILTIPLNQNTFENITIPEINILDINGQSIWNSSDHAGSVFLDESSNLHTHVDFTSGISLGDYSIEIRGQDFLSLNQSIKDIAIICQYHASST